MRAVEKSYLSGEQVFYKRDGDKASWRGPATVLGNKGTVYFLVHQGDIIRVSSCRLVSVGEAEEQMAGTENNEGTEHTQSRPSEVPSLASPTNSGSSSGIPPSSQLSSSVLSGEAHRKSALSEETHRRSVSSGDTHREEQTQSSHVFPTPTLPVDTSTLANEKESPAQQTEAQSLEEYQRPKSFPKSGDNISYKDGSNWIPGKVVSRGGKATSKKNGDYFNIETNSEQLGLHLNRVEWEYTNEGRNEEESLFAIIPEKDHGKPECIEAKQKELDSFKEFQVYDEVKDCGQERLSSRWVLTDKSTPLEKKTKAWV